MIVLFGESLSEMLAKKSLSGADEHYNLEEFYKNLLLSAVFLIIINCIMILLYCLVEFKFVMIPRAKIMSIFVISFWFL